MTEPVKSKINIMPEGNKGTSLNVTKPCYLVNDPSHEVKFIYSNRKQYLFESKMNSELYTFDVKDIDKFVFNKPESQSLLDAFVRSYNKAVQSCSPWGTQNQIFSAFVEDLQNKGYIDFSQVVEKK